MRTIKFRAQKESDGAWVYGDLITSPIHSDCAILENGCINYAVKKETVGQYTDQVVKSVEVYEDDILRDTEETDEGDNVYYCIVTWIKEWSMFAALHRNERQEYLNNGIDALDSFLFWTFPLQEEKFGDRTICGNIHDNPELINHAKD